MLDKQHNIPSTVIFDVDGVFTSGQFLYTAQGKYAKVFGAHDADGIKLLRTVVHVAAITADSRGYDITKKRIADDMDIPLTIVTEPDRAEYLRASSAKGAVIYMGDGIYDAQVFQHVAYSIAPASGHVLAREAADFVTTTRAAEGAVAEACLHILERFFPQEFSQLIHVTEQSHASY